MQHSPARGSASQRQPAPASASQRQPAPARRAVRSLSSTGAAPGRGSAPGGRGSAAPARQGGQTGGAGAAAASRCAAFWRRPQIPCANAPCSCAPPEGSAAAAADESQQQPGASHMRVKRGTARRRRLAAQAAAPQPQRCGSQRRPYELASSIWHRLGRSPLRRPPASDRATALSHGCAVDAALSRRLVGHAARQRRGTLFLGGLHAAPRAGGLHLAVCMGAATSLLGCGVGCASLEAVCGVRDGMSQRRLDDGLSSVSGCQ
jgi:hypothetical protein